MAAQLCAGETAEVSGMAAEQAFARETDDAALIAIRVVAEKMRPGLIGPEQTATQLVANQGFATGQHE